MIIRAKKMVLQFILITFTLVFLVGCSSENSQIMVPPTEPDLPDQTTPPSQTAQTTPSSQPVVPPTDTYPASSSQSSDSDVELLQNMKRLAEQGKVINSDFPVKTIALEDVIAKWGQPDKTDWVPAAKGNYSTYESRSIVFGSNKGSQVFEVRSFDKQLQKLSLAKTKEVFGTPAYDVTVSGEKIIGYTAGPEFKIEFVFPQPTNANPDPMMDHYLVLYPRGTVNSMADDPGRQW